MLNKNIKALRKAKGLSQEELAIKLNVVRQTVSKWEKGISVPDAGMVIQIAEVLDTTVNVLLGEEIPKSEEADFTKTLAAKLEVLNEQYSKQSEHRRKIWRIVFATILIVSAVSLIRYVFFFASIYQMQSLGDASTSVTVIGGGAVPAYIPIWYYFSVSKPVLLSALAAIASAIGLYRTRNNALCKRQCF
ncbi:MAG: helix-turn-helix domain-containing protein [Lachnospiraceae bacterium]|nr:helix-turn-helix domain-containing protein [Lachnospiraceae bacterium]